jgi:hypothetical protein
MKASSVERFEMKNIGQHLSPDVEVRTGATLEESNNTSVESSSRLLLESNYRTVTDFLESDELDLDFHRELDESDKMGTFRGVFIPCTQNFLGVIIFIRLFFIVGKLGIGMSLLMVTLYICL